MRTWDRALPAVTIVPLSAAGNVASWPIRPVIALQNNAGVFIDVTCYWSQMTVETGTVDRNGNSPAGRADVTLFDPTSALSHYTALLQLNDWKPGNELVIWATNGVWSNVLFRGRLARFDRLNASTIVLEAYDGTKDLATPIATPYTAGVTGDTIAARLLAVRAKTLYTDPYRFDVGTVTVSAQPSDAQPIDEMRAVVQSDGGVVFVDVDGTLRYYDRRWRGGRTDQATIPIVSPTVCARSVVWDLETTTNDVGQADVATFTNVAGLVATAQRVTPPALRDLIVGQTKQQWISQSDGDQLAAYTQRTAPVAGALAVRGFRLYALDPAQPAIAQLATDIRLFDRVDVELEQPVAPLLLSVPALVTGVVHDVAPESGWLTTVNTVRAVPYLRSVLWDDTPVKLWDETPLNYWSY